MTDPEILNWLEYLPRVNAVGNFVRCASKAERLVVVNILLDHAGEDHMTPEDKVDCERAKELISEFGEVN